MTVAFSLEGLHESNRKAMQRLQTRMGNMSAKTLQERKEKKFYFFQELKKILAHMSDVGNCFGYSQRICATDNLLSALEIMTELLPVERRQAQKMVAEQILLIRECLPSEDVARYKQYCLDEEAA